MENNMEKLEAVATRTPEIIDELDTLSKHVDLLKEKIDFLSDKVWPVIVHIPKDNVENTLQTAEIPQTELWKIIKAVSDKVVAMKEEVHYLLNRIEL